MTLKHSIYKYKTVTLNRNGEIKRHELNQAKSVIFRFGQKINLELTEICGGEFLMGSSENEKTFRENETPRHKVKVPGFYIGKYPVTQSEWFAVMDELPEIKKDFLGNDLPVVNVFIEKVFEFIDRISEITQRNFRLPTEAEWEYACRAGTNTPFAFGETITTEYANFDGTKVFLNSPKSLFRKKLTPVGSFPFANDFGLYDMHGNVWEWCGDIWHEDYNNAPIDGSTWIENGDQSYLVQRGGAWNSTADACRSAFRVGDIAHNTDHIVGLRVCMTI
jgi:formylglycine-generating enzyme required for sulfatase activity